MIVDPGLPAAAVYLDHHATTPCDPKVVDAMLPFFSTAFGNAASGHAFGRVGADHVEKARASVASVVGCEPSEIVFTSGATEADNLALLGTMEAYADRGRHLITQVTEHKAVLDSCAALERRGVEVTYLPVEPDGRVNPEVLAHALRDDTVLVSVMWANNETGTLQPMAELAEVCRRHGVLLHTDAAQALAYCDLRTVEVDLLSLSAHKAYGPKGVGALYVRRRRPRVRLTAQMHGGGHERGRRSGTLDVPGIVGFGIACELVAERREHDAEHAARLRAKLLHMLSTTFPDLHINGSMEHRLPNNLNISLPGVDAADLLDELDDIAISSGSACSSASQDGSYVLAALPDSKPLADSSLRFGLGRSTTEADLEHAVRSLSQAVDRLSQRPPKPAVCEVVS